MLQKHLVVDPRLVVVAPGPPERGQVDEVAIALLRAGYGQQVVALPQPLPLLRTHALRVGGHLLARLELRLEGLDVQFAAEQGLYAVLLAGLNLAWNGAHAAVVGDAEEALVYLLGTL